MTIQVLNRGEPVQGARVVVGDHTEQTNSDGQVACAATTDVQLVQVHHDGHDFKRWVLPDSDHTLVIDLSNRAPAESLVESLVGDRYRFLEVLGRGGMGIVIKAHDSLLNRVVAIKMLAGELEHNDEAQRIFLEEARALAPLSHPNLVSIHDIQHLQGHTLMVLEFVTGENLDRLLHVRGRFSTARVLRYVIQMARAASFMHSRGFLHRDLKPGNVIVGEDDAVKLVDFGLARSLDMIRVKGTQIRGTPAYMAPEQVLGEALTSKVDTYQLGVTLFELLTGELPFAGDMGYAHVHASPPSLSSRLPDVHPQLDALAASCLAKKPDDRPSAKELLDELQALYVLLAEDDEDAAAEVPMGVGRAADPRRTTGGAKAAPAETESLNERKGAWVLPVVVALMFLLGGGVAFFALRSPPPEPATAAPVDVSPPAVQPPIPQDEPPVEAVAVAATEDAGSSAPDAGSAAPAEAPPAAAEVVRTPPRPRPQRAVTKPAAATAAKTASPAATPATTRTSAPAIRTTRRSDTAGSTTPTKPPSSSDIRLSR